MLYGGEANHGAAETIREYDEIASFLQKEDVSRQTYIESDLYQDKWGRGKWDDDFVYRMAVYLDVGMDGRLDRARLLPRFSRHYILRDSPLTQQILPVLRQKDKASALELLDIFRSTWHQGSRAEARVDALLGLLALGEDVVLEMDAAIRDPDRTALAQMFLDRLRYLQRQLNDAVVRLDNSNEARGLVFEDVKKIRQELRDDRWTRILALVVRTLAASGHRPINMGPILDVRDNSYIQAEAWAFWYTNRGHDSYQTFAKILHTIGKQLSSAEAISHAHLAQNLRFGSDVSLREAIPPRYTDAAEVLGDVFTVAGSLQDTLAQDVIWPQGLMEFHGKPLTKENEANVDRLAEIMTFTPERRDEILSGLAPELSKESELDPWAQVVERAFKLEDPAIRSRALWRLSRLIEIWRGRRLLEEAVDSAEQIDDPLARSRAFERLLPRVPRKQRSILLQQAVDSARTIDDPENRSRALGRMALRSSSGKAEGLWQEALGVAEHVTEPGHRVETLILLRPHLSRYPELLERTRRLLTQVKDPWHRLDGEGLLSTKFLEIHTQFENAVTWVPIVLAALAKDLTDRYSATESLGGLWNRLIRTDHRETSLRIIGERSESVVEAMQHALEARDKAGKNEADAGEAFDLVTAAETGLRDLALTSKTSSPEELGRGLYFQVTRDVQQARETAQSVAESPPMQELLAEWLACTLREAYLDEGAYFKRAALLYLASHVAPLAPAAFAAAAESRSLGDDLLEAAQYNGQFYGREGAAKLVGYLRRVSSGVTEFLEHTLRDVQYVQTAALQTARRLRHIDENTLPQLLENLYHLNASLAYATAQILSAFGRNEKLPSKQRQAILGALADAVRDLRSQRGVYFMAGSGGKDDPYRVGFLTRLDQAFYKVLLEIAGVA